MGKYSKSSPKSPTMAEPILSPDGLMELKDGKWVHRNATIIEGHKVQDSVIMGDINTNVTHNHSTSVHNTVIQDSERLIRSHLNTMVDALVEERDQDAKKIFESAKQIDYDFAIKLHNEEYLDKIVEALYFSAKNYCSATLADLYTRNETRAAYLHRFNHNWRIGYNKLYKVLKWNSNHLPTLFLIAEMYDKGKLDNKYRETRLIKIYNEILKIDPSNTLAKNSLDQILKKKKRRTMIKIIISVTVIPLYLVVASFVA